MKQFADAERGEAADNDSEGSAEKARVDALIKRTRRRVWRLKCMYSIPDPQQLAIALVAVYDFFKGLVDPETGRAFFSAGHHAVCLKELQYVAQGLLSAGAV